MKLNGKEGKQRIFAALYSPRILPRVCPTKQSHTQMEPSRYSVSHSYESQSFHELLQTDSSIYRGTSINLPET